MKYSVYLLAKERNLTLLILTTTMLMFNIDHCYSNFAMDLITAADSSH